MRRSRGWIIGVTLRPSQVEGFQPQIFADKTQVRQKRRSLLSSSSELLSRTSDLCRSAFHLICGFAASRAESLQLSVRSLEKSEASPRAAQTQKSCELDGKPEAFRTGCGKAAKACAHRGRLTTLSTYCILQALDRIAIIPIKALSIVNLLCHVVCSTQTARYFQTPGKPPVGACNEHRCVA